MSDTNLIPLTPEVTEASITKILDALKLHRNGVEAKLSTVSLPTMQLAVKSMRVWDDETYAQAVAIRNQCASQEKIATDGWDGLTKAAHSLHKACTGNRLDQSSPWSSLANQANQKIDAYLLEQKRLRLEQEAALAREADRIRKELEKESEDLMAKGLVAQAVNKEQLAGITVAPVLPESVPKVTGNRVVDGYEGEVTDIKALCKAIGDGTFPLNHNVKGVLRPIVTVDQVVVNALVSRHLGGTKIPGITIKETVKSRPTRR